MANDLQPSYYTSRWTGEEIDRLLEGKNMVITERVASLSTLKSKYPSGKDGYFLTTDTKRVYWWDKTAKEWVDLGAIQGPQGPKGNGIDDFERTSGTGLAGSLDVYTFYLDDGSEFSFTVQNGRDGNVADAEAANELARRLLQQTQTAATEASTSASAAAKSATAAGNSATSASGSASQALAAQKSASTAATTASSKAESASQSASSASGSASAASKSATAAASSQKAASTSETNAKTSATAAKESASSAANSATTASGAAAQAVEMKNDTANLASAAEEDANSARQSALDAAASKSAIENMKATAHSIEAGSEATVTKSVASGVVTLYFGIPRGQQGATGPRGPQGVAGPTGPQGPAGTVVPADGLYGFSVNSNGHLILSYSGSTAPQFELKSDGHLYYTL